MSNRNISIDQKNATIGLSYAENVHTQHLAGKIVYSSAQNQSLAEAAAAEIQKLLQQLEGSYSIESNAGKKQMVTEMINRIDSNPALAQRIIRSLSAGSASALISFLNHPAASFVITALDEWQKSKRQG